MERCYNIYLPIKLYTCKLHLQEVLLLESIFPRQDIRPKGFTQTCRLMAGGAVISNSDMIKNHYYSVFPSFFPLCVCTCVRADEAKHMREIVVDETMTDMDKNHDGFVELGEYLRK